MVGLAQQSVFGVKDPPTTLTGNCGDNPGVTCRLVWNVTHNGTATTLTREFLAGPVHLLLEVGFAVLLALVIQAVVHRVINRLTERATHSMLTPFWNGAGNSRFVPSRATAGRVRRRLVRKRRSPTDDSIASDSAALKEAAAESADPALAGVVPLVQDTVVQAGTVVQVGTVDHASDGEVNGAAAQAEAALVDERRKQRVRALGAILRSAASVTIFSIAGFVILGDLGINLAPLLASAGVVGVAVGFGAQSLVRDYLSGIFMLVEDQYGVGDVITVGDATGTVENVTLRITRLRDVNGIVWHIRNGGIEVVGNESQGWARAVIDFPVPFEADLVKVRNILQEAGDMMWNEPTWRVVMLEAPEVWGAQEISAEEVVMRVVAKTAPLRQWEVEREMRARVKAALHEAGVMPTPAAEAKLTVKLTRDE